MWKAPKDMSDAELREGVETMEARKLQTGGHLKARRLQEQIDRLRAEQDRRREAQDFKLGDYAPQAYSVDEHYECCIAVSFEGKTADIVGEGTTKQLAVVNALQLSATFVASLVAS